jgi:hypothetical protein
MHALTQTEAADVPRFDEEPSHDDIPEREPGPANGVAPPLIFPRPPDSRDLSSSPGPRRRLGLPRWPWGKVAAIRAELEDAQAQLTRLRQDIALHVEARHELNRSHAAAIAQLEAHADARARELVEAAVHATREQAARDAATIASQHEDELAAARNELAAATARITKLEDELPGALDAVRRDAKIAHDAEIWALRAQADAQLESARQDHSAALAALTARLQSDAAAQVDAAVRTFQAEAAHTLASTIQQHEAAMSSVRAELQHEEARRTRLERELPLAVERARQEERTAHAAHVSTIEAQAAAQVDTMRRDVDTALAILAEELEAKATAHLETTLHAAREESARVAAETAQQHAAVVANLKAQIDDLEARRAKLAHDLPLQLEATRREAASAHAGEVAALRAQAAAQVEAAVREAREEAARSTADMATRHEAALVALRAERDDAEARRLRLAQDLDVEMAKRRQAALAHAAEIALLQEQAGARLDRAIADAQDEAVRQATETAQRHAAALAALRAEVDATEARRVKLEQELPTQVEAARREAAAAHAVEVAALRAHAAAQIEVAVREVRDEAARAAAEVGVRHTAALAALRHELDEVNARCVRLDQDLAVQAALRREAAIAHAVERDALRAEAVAQMDSAVRDARDDAARAAAEMAARHAIALGSLRTELEASEARRQALERDISRQLDDVRADAEAAHASAAAALRLQAAAQVEAAVREVREEAAQAAADTKANHEVAVATVRMEARAELARAEAQITELMRRLDASRVDGAIDTLERQPTGVLIVPAMRQKTSARQMAAVTAALVLSGFAGSLIAWSVAAWGLLQ